MYICHIFWANLNICSSARDSSLNLPAGRQGYELPRDSLLLRRAQDQGRLPSLREIKAKGEIKLKKPHSWGFVNFAPPLGLSDASIGLNYPFRFAQDQSQGRNKIKKAPRMGLC